MSVLGGEDERKFEGFQELGRPKRTKLKYQLKHSRYFGTHVVLWKEGEFQVSYEYIGNAVI